MFAFRRFLTLIHRYFILLREGGSLKDKVIILIGLPNFVLKRLFKGRFCNLLSGITLRNEDGVFFCGKDIRDVVRPATFFESDVREFIVGLKRDSVFVDVGSNIGKYTIMMGRRLNKGVVVSIEPEPRNFKILKRNVELNGLSNVFLVNEACFHEEKRIKFYVEGGHSSIYKESDKWIFVKARKLDDILEELGVERVDLIKIDVEGAEADVLKGARKTLKNNHPKIVFEAWNDDYLKKIKTVLKPFNYKIKKINNTNYFAY